MKTQGSAILKKTAVKSFWNAYNGINDPFDGLVASYTSTQITDTYVRLGDAPMPQQWVGPKKAKVLPELSFTVTNEPFESAIKIGKKTIKAQQWDEVGEKSAQMGMKARAHRIKQWSDLLNNGASAAGDDGQYFFDTDHADSGAAYTTSQDNDLTSNINPLAPTDLEFATAVRGMFDSLYARKDNQGDPWIFPGDSASNFIVMVPPMYRSIALRVLNADSLTGPLGNDLKGTYTVRVNQYLTTPATTGQFFMLYSGSVHKPIAFQMLSEVELMDNLDGDEYHNTGDATFSTEQWNKAFYGQWRCAVLWTFT